MVEFNDNNEVLREERHRAILAGLQTGGDISYSMDELAGLAEAAGVEVAGQMIQKKERPDTALYFGKGKVEEIQEMCANMEADMVIFNDELSGIQLRNLEEQLDVIIIDRTVLILDIFANRAISREGKLQVELAQLQYRKPRLRGMGKSLSRAGSGIGTRGPGEKKLETDRRHIERRMDEIRKELEETRHNRSVQRSKRQKSGIPVAALVGYTNSGKSAIMNRLLAMGEKSDKSVLVEDMLFATLDTAQRNITLDSKHEFILIDTVGFVSKLPHGLIKAFKATLEEVSYADLLIHVVDASYPDHDFHIQITNKVLEEIGAADKERLYVYNKMDLVDQEEGLMPSDQNTLFISAKTGYNMDALTEAIKAKLFSDRVSVRLLIPYERGDISAYLHEKCRIINVKHIPEGTEFEVELCPADFNRLEAYRIGVK